MLIQFSAEAFDRTCSPGLLNQLQEAKIDVRYINRCYGGELTLVCEATKEQAEEVKHFIWGRNHGLCVEYWVISPDTLEEII